MTLSASPAGATPGREPLEPPPPGTRVMGALRWVLVLAMAAVAAGAWVYTAGGDRPGPQAEARYTCPMHPAVVADHPGECPICGMDLVPARPAAAAEAHAEYACPMHPEVRSTDPAARCPKCGMRLEAVKPGPAGLARVELGPDRAGLAGIRAEPVTRAQLVTEVRAPAVVAAPEQAQAVVTSRLTGYVEELHARETGARVRRGEVLLTLASPEITALQQGFQSAVRWSSSGRPGTGRAGEAADGAVDREARRKLEGLGLWPEDLDAIARAPAPLPSLPVRAPISGVVVRRGVSQGSLVQPGTELFALADLTRAWVIAAVPEADAGAVRVGQPVAVALAAWPSRALAGKVSFVYPGLTDARALQVRVELPNPRGELLPGMSGTATFSASREALTAPAEAVVDAGEATYAFVALPGGQYEPRRVRAGARGVDRVEILEGLAEGEAVVAAGTFFLDSESRLRAAASAPGVGATARVR